MTTIAFGPTAWRTSGWLIVLGSLLLLSPLLGVGPGLLDDIVYFHSNPLIHGGGWRGLVDVWTGQHFGHSPITHLSIWLDWRIGGGEIWVFRTSQALWYGVMILGLRAFLAAWTGNRLLATVVACLCAVHPMLFLDGAWLAMRRQILCLAAVFWALAWFIQGIDSEERSARRRAFTWCLLLILAAAFSRFLAVIALPLMIAVLVERRRSLRAWPWTTLAITGCGLAAYTLLSIIFAQSSSIGYRLGASLGESIWLNGVIYAQYLWRMLAPWRLTAYYSVTEDGAMDAVQVGAWLGLVGIIVASCWCASNRWRVAAAWLAIAGVLLPVSNIIPSVFAAADHYAQTALPFLILIVYWHLQDGRAWLAGRGIVPSSLWPAALVAILAVSWGIASWHRLPHLRSQLLFFSWATRIDPDSGPSWAYLAYSLNLSGSVGGGLLAEEAGYRAITARDSFRIPPEQYGFAAFKAVDHLVRTRSATEAIALAERIAPTFLPIRNVMIRAYARNEAKDPVAALAILREFEGRFTASMDEAWGRMVAGRLPRVQHFRNPDGSLSVSAFPVDDVLSVKNKESLWESRFLTLLAMAASGAGDHLLAAKAASLQVYHNSRVADGWLRLAKAAEHLGMEDLARRSRARLRHLQEEQASGIPIVPPTK